MFAQMCEAIHRHFDSLCFPNQVAVRIHYDVSSRLINLTSFEEHQHDAVPLYLQFKYEPSQPYAPIHEIVEGHNKRTKEFYWQLWFGDDEELPELDVHDTFTGPEVTISANDVEAFILGLPGQLPTFLIVDALDECSNTSGTPSAREEVLEFLEDLVGPSHPNLFVCITSRPEQDIQTVLNPLTYASRLVSLHEEGGQREDIESYVRSFVHKDRAMRRWRAEDRELVITTLSERAGGM
jgi:hypothetical protein